MINDTFVELCRHRFGMQPLQNPPLCSCTLHAICLKKLSSSVIPISGFIILDQGITKRCRPSLLTNSALVYESQCGGDWWGFGVSANEYSCAHHGALSPNQLWRSTVPPYLTYTAKRKYRNFETNIPRRNIGVSVSISTFMCL